MSQICTQNWCQQPFEVTATDAAFYAQMGVPAPTLCPDCRQQRRMAFRNERQLYHRSCSLCQKTMISIYRPEAAFPVYCADCWWGDGWRGQDFGCDFDFNRPFFAQLAELQKTVPRLYMFATQNENSDYTNGSLGNKDCYLTFVSDHNESVLFSYSTFNSAHALDLMSCKRCELCYECVGCEGCYELRYAQNCVNCSSSFCLLNCQSCESCAFSTNLRQKRYCLFNEQLTKAEYECRLAELKLDTYAGQQAALRYFREVCQTATVPAAIGTGNENCSGDGIYNSRNARACFDSHSLEDAEYITYGNGAKNCLDGYVVVDGSELAVEVCSAIALFHGGFNFAVWFCAETWLSDLCDSGTNLFGCVGLKKAQYCILNKQYSKAEYEELVPKIIAHMQQTGEWGQFFPVELSPFAYNETVANDYFPLTREEVAARGWRWQAAEVSNAYLGPKFEVPESLADVPDDITSKILTCEVTGKNYKIIPQELAFYRKMQLPLPRRCPDQRHRDRLALRNPRQLFLRACAECGGAIQTTFSPNRPERVLCEACYQQTVY